ncbi:bifunctional RNase H/acid phosphatase [Nonomuraea africana]|uniref:Phosphoglycerate mutase n=1 Tax=Nonomuraea africana TaxID=46171 RepID=A0ABR9K884_9ACTN|nr:bifunctional RNase H/acid phosphatase [Nonomuraea africana]MBE1558215.1 putative phosphoglycerate mutase [Nonomuraea africana]
MSTTAYLVEADGGSRGNPGPAGYGAVVMDARDRQVLAEAAEAIGVATNNVAEYRGLIAGLSSVLDLGGEGATVEVRMDSKLVIEQMAGRWKIKNEGLRPLAIEAQALVRRLRVTGWTWIPRERNKHADRLANEAMDAAAKGLAWKAGGTTAGLAASDRPTGPYAPTLDTPPSDRVSQGAASQGLVGGSASGVSDARRGEQTDLLDLSAPSASLVTAQQTKGTGWGPATRVATSLLLLRHGETPLSAERRFSGLGDPELTPNGLAQADAAARRLSAPPYRIDVVVSSPLKRARRTAQAVAGSVGLDVEVDEDLRETDFGAWEGHTFTEIQRRWPTELAAWLADPTVAPPQGESFVEVARRVEAARDRLVERYEGRTVLVVSHVTPIKTLLRLALLAPPEALYRMHLDLACLSLIDFYADGPAVVKSFNDISHLR